MNKENTGMHYWKHHALPYFRSVCDDVFTSYMLKFGFAYQAVSEYGPVAYVHDNIVFKLSYTIMESAVPYSLQATIGHTSTPNQCIHEIGVWELLPPGNPLRDYSSWFFMNREELNTVLLRFRDEIVEIFVATLLVDEGQLVSIIEASYQEKMQILHQTWQQELLELARKYFQLNMYDQSLEYYKEIDCTYLSNTDRKRIIFARKKVDQS